MCNQWY